MQLTVLGKYGPYPAAGGGTSSYLVQGDHDAVVLDFGSGALGRLQQHVHIGDVRAIVLSHLHYDHICDLLPLSYCLGHKGIQMDLVVPQCDCFERTLIEKLNNFNILPMQSQMQIGEFSFSFAPMVHPLQSYAMRVTAQERILFYSGDTAFCPQLTGFASDSHLLLLDCGKPDKSDAPHLSLYEAAFLAKTLQTPAIASHINPALTYSSPSPLVTVAQEGKTYNV